MNAPASPRVRVLCIGSPTVPDDLGFLAARALSEHVDSDLVEILALDRPGPGVLAHMRGADAVILVDAVKSGALPGTLHRLEGRALDGLVAHPASSHGFGLSETLALAKKMDLLPPRLRFVGLEIGSQPPAPSEILQLVHAIAEETRQALSALPAS